MAAKNDRRRDEEKEEWKEIKRARVKGTVTESGSDTGSPFKWQQVPL